MKKLGIAALVVIALAIVMRLVLDPIAAHYAHRELDRLDGFQGDFAGLHVTLFPPGVTVTRLALWPKPDGSPREPLFSSEVTHASVAPRDLLHRRLVASLRLEQPKVSIVQREKAPPKPQEKAKPAPDLAPQLSEAIPFRVARVEVVGGELLFRDDTAPLHPQLWVHHIELAAENVVSRPGLDQGRPARVTARGTVGDSGTLEVFVSADPLARPLAFAGRVSMRHFEASELYAFLEPKTHAQTPHGTIDVFAQFTSRAGELRGGVKAVLANLDVRPTSDGVWNRLRAWLGDKAVKLASDRVPGRDAVATTVPITGSLTSPDVQLWPAVLGVVRNAFVEGLASGFSNLPPPTAPEPEGKLKQATNALSKDAGPPRAQPAKPATKAPAKPAAPRKGT